MPEAATDTDSGSYGASFGAMATDASRATASIASAAREKVAADTKITGEMTQRGEEDRARAAKALDKSGVGPDEFKPWNAEIEHKKYESDPLQGFASSGAMFAMIASAFTKAPMLSAIEGMAGALNGIKEGNEASYTRAFNSYKENVKTAKAKHEIEHQAYQDALALGTHDQSLAQAKFRAEAARFGDKQLLALAENGMIKEIYDTIAARNKSMESASALADRATIRTMQQQALKASFAQIDQQQGPPGPDGQPTPVSEAAKAAQKLRQISTVYSAGEMKTPQQIATMQYLMEHPTASAEELTAFLEKHNIIKPAGGAGGAKGAEDKIIRARAEEIVAEERAKGKEIPLTEAMGRARTEAKPDSKTGAAMRERTIASRANELRQEDPEMSESEANSKARREIAVESSAPSGNQIDKIRGQIDQGDNAIKKAEKILDFLDKYKGGAGLVGKIMRGEEIASNIVGAGTQSDRVQFRRDVLELQEIAPRLLTDSAGRPLKSDQSKISAVIAGLESGDTGPNTKRAMREFVTDIRKRVKDWKGRIDNPHDSSRTSSGAEEGEASAAPGAKKAPADWPNMYPKKGGSDRRSDSLKNKVAGDMWVAPADEEPLNESEEASPGWAGNSEDKMRAMNLLRRESLGEKITPEARQWLDDYMRWVDRTAPPIGAGR